MTEATRHQRTLVLGGTGKAGRRLVMRFEDVRAVVAPGVTRLKSRILPGAPS